MNKPRVEISLHDGSKRTVGIPVLALLFLAVIIDMIGYGLVLPLLPVYVERLGGGATLVGALGAFYALIQGLCGPLLGALSDRYGRRPLLMICLLGTGLGYVLLGLANTLWMLILALLLDSATGGNLSIAQAYVADHASAERRARDFALLSVAFGLGITTGPFLAGLLSGYGLHVPALVAAALACTNLVFVALALPESLAPDQRINHGSRILNPFVHLRELRQAGGAVLAWLLLTITLVNLPFAGLQSNFPIFSRVRFGWNAAMIAYFFGFVGLCGMLTQGVLVGLLRRWFSERQLALTGATIFTLGLPLISFASAGWQLYPIAALIALGSGLCIPVLSSLLAERAGSLAQGRVMGAQQVAINLALMAGPLTAGLAFDGIGPAAPPLVGACFALAGLITLARATRVQPSPPE